MFRVFSGSCLSLEDMEVVRRPNLVERPHVLGPGVDFFTEDGHPVCPQPGAHILQKVFSGSALDLNAMNSDMISDDDNLASPGPQQRMLPISTILNQLTTESERERVRTAKSKITVLVVGDNSYVASHVVAKLLETGYTVRMTLPDALHQRQHMDLYCMNREVAQRLAIIEADMTSSTDLRDAIRGCKYVVHCGCPTTSTKGKPPVEYHVDAVQALFDAIRLAGRASIKRVVLTGAASSVFHITDPDPPSGVFDENCWNTMATAETDPVPFAKMVFEREAWRLKQMLGVELVVLLPAISIGPSRTEETSEAMVKIQNLASSPCYFPFTPNLYWNFVDVRDVAEAHVRALELPGVKDERIIISNQNLCYAQISRIIKDQFPHLTPATRNANKFLTLLIGATQSAKGVKLRFLWRSLGVRKCLSNKRAVDELGLRLTPIEETVQACVEQMIGAGELPAAGEPPCLSVRRNTTLAVVGLAIATGIAIAAFRRKGR